LYKKSGVAFFANPNYGLAKISFKTGCCGYKFEFNKGFPKTLKRVGENK